MPFTVCARWEWGTPPLFFYSSPFSARTPGYVHTYYNMLAEINASPITHTATAAALHCMLGSGGCHILSGRMDGANEVDVAYVVGNVCV